MTSVTLFNNINIETPKSKNPFSKTTYSNEPTEDEMRIIIKFKENVLSMELMDKGKPVVPSNIKPRDLDDIKAGGLGTFFIGQIMDEVVFKTTKVNWVNHLILTKAF